MALLALALGCAALVTAVAVIFGTTEAAIVTGAATVFYFTLNVVLGAKHDDDAAAGVLSRLFRVSWVTYAANVVVWLAAIGVFASPAVREALYGDFTVTVVDELQLPAADANVTFELGLQNSHITLDEAGRGRISYPRYWGGETANLRIDQRGHITEQTLTRVAGRFADLTLGVQSSVPRFRVTHVTLRSGAIDAVLKGHTPPEIAELFPDVAGVVRNSVWRQANEVLEFYNSMHDVPDGSETGYMGTVFSGRRSDGAEVSFDNEGAARGVPGWIRDVRIPETGFAEAQIDFSQGIFGCPINVPLGADFRVEVHSADIYSSGNQVRFDRAARAAVTVSRLNVAYDDSGLASVALRRLADHAFLSEVLRSSAIQTLENDIMSADGMRRYIEYFVRHQAPAGIVDAHLFLTTQGCADGFPPHVSLTLPPPILRVTVIENVSSDVLSVDEIESTLTVRSGFASEGDRQRVERSPWPGGVLRPGEGIVVPRRLMFEGALSPSDVSAWRSASAGEQSHLEVVGRREGSGEPTGALGFTIGANQIVQRTAERYRRGENSPRYTLGSSVEDLAIRVNGVLISTREDTGLTLAIFAGNEVGSCPFVFVSVSPQEPMLNRGHVITDHVGPSREGTDRIYLGQQYVAAEIREIEHEVSYLNQVRLIVRQRDGRERAYAASDTALSARDSEYAQISQGDRLALSFAYQRHEDDEAVFLEVTGYYVPLATTFNERAALRMQGVF